jgi:prepilin signal peptidase PulO-like enzyme (type II secretory pathway)
MQRRPPLTGLGKLTLTGFVGLLAATWWKILFLDGLVAPAIASGVLFLATTAGLLAVRSRWMSALAAAVATFAVLGAAQAQEVRDMLATPSQVGDFTSTVLLLAAAATGAIGGIATTVQRSRTPRATATPR